MTTHGMHVFACTLVSLVGVLATPADAQKKNLFDEAGQSMERSEWIRLRQMPVVQLHLRADDTVVVRSVRNPADAFALKIDGDALATDCAPAQQVKQDYSGWGNDTHVVNCTFPEGTTKRIQAASVVVLQASMLKKTTKALSLSDRKLENLQELKR